MVKRTDVSECKECYLKGCNCVCNTCVRARKRNDKLSSHALLILQFADALEVDVTDLIEFAHESVGIPRDLCILKKEPH